MVGSSAWGLFYLCGRRCAERCAPYARDLTAPPNRKPRPGSVEIEDPGARRASPLGVIKPILGFAKVWYRGLEKKHRPVIAGALANLFRVRKCLLRLRET